MLFTPWLHSVRSRQSRIANRNRRAKVDRRTLAECLEQRTLLAAQFVSVSPNVGAFLTDGVVRTESPKELNFQFSPGSTIDSTTLAAIRLVGAGYDGGFTPANTVTDLGTNGAVLLQIGSRRLGSDDNGALLTVNVADRGGAGPNVISNAAGDLTLTLDSNTLNPTTAQQLIDYASTNAAAKQLITINYVSGNLNTSLATVASSTRNLTGAGAASVISNFGAAGLNVRFIAAQPGIAGNDIAIQVNRLDLGSASASPILNVVGRRLEITVNENATTPTTAQSLINAINSSPSASLLLSASLLTDTAAVTPGTTSLANVADGSILRLSGADRPVAASATWNFQSTSGVQLQFTARQQGLSGNDISIQFQRSDRGSASAAPLVIVNGSAVTVQLNSNVTAPTTANALLAALAASTAANALISVKLVSGLGTANLSAITATSVSGPVVQLAGADAGVSPGSRSLQTSNRDVIYRFAAPPSNDLYQIEVIGTGTSPLKDTSNQPVNNGADTFLDFSLDLGANVTSVVPQPILRQQDVSVSNVARITDGDTITIDSGNGGSLVTFELNSGASGAVRSGNKEIVFTSGMTQAQVATAIRDAINNAAMSDANLTVAASLTGTTRVSITGNAVNARVSVKQKDATALTQAEGGLVQRQSLVNVYFNDDNLNPTLATSPQFYALFDTKGTSSTSDDTILIPQSVSYNATTNLATLTFSGNLPTSTYRLQISSSHESDNIASSAVQLGTLFSGSGYSTQAYLGDNGGAGDTDLYSFDIKNSGNLMVSVTPDSSLTPTIRLLQADGTSAVAGTNLATIGNLKVLTATGLPTGKYFVEVTSVSGASTGSYRVDIDTTSSAPSGDGNSSYATATSLGTLGDAGSTIAASIAPQSVAIPSPPGSDDEPGHRNIPVEAHGQGDLADPTPPGAIPVINYFFPDVYGSVLGQPVRNQISEAQKDLTRFIFETFSRYTGTQYIETASSGISIASGDIRAADPTLPVTGVAGISTVIINAIQNGNDNTYAGGWMGVAFHEIGHAIGLGHSSDLASFMDGNGGGPNPETPTSYYDMTHLGHAYPKNSTDIDLYRFDVATAGAFTAEVTARRSLPNSSSLDAAITLFRDPYAKGSSDFGTSGATEVSFIAKNAGVFGNDISLTVQKNDFGGAVANNATVTVSGHSITVVLNTNAGNHTTAANLVAALTANAQASLLITATFAGTNADVTGIPDADSTIVLSGGNREVIARNDDYYGYDPFVGVDLQPGTYYVGISAKGNMAYDPTVSDTGFGGQSDGSYSLRLSLRQTPTSELADTDQGVATPLDGDGDLIAGGTFNYWFESGTTIYVDKTTTTVTAQQDGTVTKPFSTIAAAVSKASRRIVLPASGASGLADGDYFSVNDGSNLPVVFEFDTNSSVIGSNHAINISGSPTVSQIVTAVQSAINAAGLLTTAVGNTSTGVIDLTNVSTLDVSGSNGLLRSPNLIRIVGNGGTDRDTLTPNDATPYVLGVSNVGATLADGRNFDVPQGVTVMIDAGAVIKLQSASIDAGTSSVGVNRQNGAVQVLGTPNEKVYLTSFRNDALGGNSDGASTGPVGGHWEGIVLRHDSDMNLAGTPGLGSEVYLNSVYQADISYGGGQDLSNNVYDPIDIRSQRPTIAYTTISSSASHAISATPDSFDDSNNRIGPDVHGNTFIKNSVNGLFIRITTALNQPLEELHVNARLKASDFTYVLTENLEIVGNAGGAIRTNNIQRLSVLGQPTSGFIVVNGSVPIPFNANASEIQTALEAVYGGGNVKVSGGSLSQADVTVEFIVNQGSKNVAQMTIDNTSLVGGSIKVATVQAGGNVFARPGGRLLMDPGVVLKLGNARIEGKRGSANLIAEGTSGHPVVFTSVKDDRFGGGGGTFDLQSDGSGTGATNTANPGDWGGLLFNLNSHLSLDQAYLAYAGGQTPVEGGSGSFNAVELHEATGRIANATFEFNASGVSNPGPDGKRADRESNSSAVIFVRGAQPVIVNNVFHQNAGAVVNIDANALRAENVIDLGRSTGMNEAFTQFTDNQGPLVRLNRMQNDSNIGAILGMQVRGLELDNATVWDDTDIVHVLQGTISVNKFHTSGGIRLQSAVDASLVVKLFGGASGFSTGTDNADLLEVVDRVGGSMQVVGTPGFPVILTSLRDDTVGASLTPSGFPQTDTNGDASATAPAAGDWGQILFDKYSNDRNVAVLNELEKPFTSGTDLNSTPSLAQFIGDLGPNDKSANENRRAGFEIHGTISEDAPNDLDVYKFTADAGTEVWLDIDRTNPSLDTVVELINAAGNVLARSQSNPGLQTNALQSFSVVASDMEKSPELGGDYYATTINDAGMRLTLPGGGTYYVRVRSNPGAGNLSDLRGGLTSGQYQLQIRLRQRDEQPGVAVSLSEIRYATNGVHVKGLPYHSPLTAEATETTTDNQNVGGAQPLGNLLASDRGSVGIGGTITGSNDLDFYQFTLDYQQIQKISGVNNGGKDFPITIDLDWADGFTRPDTTIALFDSVGTLLYVGRESNVQDDQPRAGQPNSDAADLTRGSGGFRDGFIGSIEVPATAATYYLAVATNQRHPTALNAVYQSASSATAVRLEPVNSLMRVVEDHVGFVGYDSNGSPVSPYGLVDQGQNGGTGVKDPTVPLVDIANRFTLSSSVDSLSFQDLVLFTNQANRLLTVDPLTANRATRVSDDLGLGGPPTNTLQDMVMRSDGVLYGYQRIDTNNGSNTNNSRAGQLVTINTGTGAFTTVGADNIPSGSPTNNTSPIPGAGTYATFEQTTNTDDVDALTFRRNDVGNYDLFYSVRENGASATLTGATTFNSKLYAALPSTGSAAAGATTPGGIGTGRRGDIQLAGTTPAVGSRGFSDGTNAGVLSFQTRAQGTQANDVQLILTLSTQSTAVTSAANGVVTVRVFADFANSSFTSLQTVVDTINSNRAAQQILTAVVSSGSNGTTVRTAATMSRTDVLTTFTLAADDSSGKRIQGNVTGLAFSQFSGGTLYGVTSGEGSVTGTTGGSQLITINPSTGVATIVKDFTSLNIGTTGGAGSPNNGFQGLHLGPQNLPIVVGTLVNPMAANTTTIASVQLNTVNPLPTGSFDLLIGSELMRATRLTSNTVSVVRDATVATSHQAGDSTSIPGYFKNTLFAVTLDGRMVAINTDATLGAVGSGMVAFESGNQVQTISVVGQQTTLVGGLTAGLPVGATTINVANGSVFTSPTPFDIQIGTERMRVTNVAGNVLTVTRGLDSTNRTTLSAAIASGTTTLNVTNASFFTTATPFTIRVDNELMRVTGVSVGAGTITVARGVGGTTAVAHAAGGTIYEISATTHSNGDVIHQLSSEFTLSFDDGAQISTTAPIQVIAAGGVSLSETAELDDVAYAGTYTLSFVNNLYHTTALSQDVADLLEGDSDTIFVQDTTGFPAAPFNIRIENEVMRVTAVGANSFSVTRGINGTTAVAHQGDTTSGGTLAPRTVYEVLTTALTSPVSAAASTTLTSGIDAVTTTLSVASVAAFPAGDGNPLTVDFQIRIDNEDMDVLDVGASTLTVARGANGTAATIHGANVSLIRIDDVLNVTDTTSFTVPSTIRIGNEDIRITSLGATPTTQFNVLRGYNGTTSAAHASGDLVYRVETTSSLNYNATASQIQTAIEALPSVAVGDVFVFNGPTGATPTATLGTPVSIQFQNGLANRDLVQLTGDTSNLQGDEIQRITLGSTFYGGNFKLTFNDGTTSRQTGLIPYNAPATGAGSVQEALEALSNIGVGNVQVSGGALPGNPIDIQFIGKLQDRDFALMTMDSSQLQNYERQQFNITGAPTGGTFTITVAGVGTTNAIAFNANAAAVQSVFDASAAFGAGAVTVTGGTLPGGVITVTFTGASFADVNVSQMTLNLGSLTGGAPVANVATLVQGNTTGTVTAQREGSAVYVNVATTQDGILSAFDALANLPSGAINGTTPDIQVTGGSLPGSPINVTFTGAYAGLSSPKLLVDNSEMVNDDGIDLGTPATGEAEVVVAITGSPGDGLPDNFIISNTGVAGLQNSRGLAFSPLDINLWHPTMNRNIDVGHGILPAPDNTRTPSKAPQDIAGGLDTKTQFESTGGASLYFGLEQTRSGTGSTNTNYFAYSTANGQLGVQNQFWQDDLTSNASIRNNYNLPGGAFGKMTTNSFSLAGYAPEDKPTFYFSYFLATENAQAASSQKTMRDSARVFVSSDGGQSWTLIATNNSALASELPEFLDHDTALNSSPVQELYETSNWRQARIDLSQFAGQSDLRFRFDFSTAGKIGEAIDPSAATLPGEDNGQFSREISDSTGTQDDQDVARERGQNNAFEGFYVDDFIVGFSERGEQVTMPAVGVGGTARSISTFDDLYANARTNLNNLQQPPSIVLTGSYQLEIRRGTDYAAPASPTKPEYIISQTFDTNDRQISGQPLQQPPYVETFDVADEFNEAGIKHTLFISGAPDDVSPFGYTNAPGGISTGNWSESYTQAQTAPRSWGSTPISIGQYSSTRLVNLDTGDGQVSFDVMVDAGSQPSPNPLLLGADFNAFQFYIDGVQQPIVVAGTTLPFDQLPGTGTPTPSFVQLSYNVTAGSHTFEWVYFKGNTNVNGTTDAVYIDNLVIPKPDNQGGRIGDQNVPREQGMVVVSGNLIRNVSGSGIQFESGTRDTGNNFSYPGSVRNVPVTANTARLVTSALISNNVVSNFGVAGIQFNGDPLSSGNGANPATEVPMGKIINNTIYGSFLRTGSGIVVNTSASPTIMNNIIANTATAISFDASTLALTSQPDVTFNHFQNNVSNGTTTGTNAVIASNSSPLFVSPSTYNFYLSPSQSGSPNQAIDSSLDVRQARTLYTNVTGPMGIPQQDMFAPDSDRFGQSRLADTSATAAFNVRPIGVGSNAFKDRGAVERADFNGPTASLTTPLDNAAGVDLDPTATSVFLSNPQFLNQFVVTLTDPGTYPNAGVGVDDTLPGLVNGTAFTLTQTLKSGQRTLLPNVDYTYAYNANTNEAIFTSVTVFPSEARYNILIDQNLVKDVAGNLLVPNQTLSGTTEFNILVTNGPNDPPTVDLVAPFIPPVLNENTVATPTSISFSAADGRVIALDDPDAFISTNELQVTLTGINGTVSLPANLGSFGSVTLNAGTGTNDSAVTFTATIPVLNLIFQGGAIAADRIRFTPTQDFNSKLGTVALKVSVDDLGNFSADVPPDPKVTEQQITIQVDAVNSVPAVSAPSTVTISEDSSHVFSGTVVVDDAVDGNFGIEQVKLSVSRGKLSLNNAALVGLVSVSGDGSNTVTFEGTITALNSALNGLSYTPNSNYNGSDTLTVTINDEGNDDATVIAPSPSHAKALTFTAKTNIVVNAVNDAPLNLFNGSSSFPGVLTGLERTAFVFNVGNPAGGVVSVADVDTAESTGTLQVTLTATDGTLTLTKLSGLTFSGPGDGIADTTMTFTGLVSDINAALDGLAFMPTNGFTSSSAMRYATVTILTEDLGATGSGAPVLQSDSDLIQIDVLEVNDPPTITITNASEVVDEDSALTIGTSKANPIVVAESTMDPAPAADFQVTISASHGVISLNPASIASLLFTYSDSYGAGAGDGSADSTMTFQGSLAEINAALDGLVYSPTSNYNGADSIDIVVNDRGQSGAGGARTANSSISVNVRAVNDAPVVTAPSVANALEDSKLGAADVLVFSNANGNAVVVSDPIDGPNAGIYDVSLAVSSTGSTGTLRLGASVGAAVITGNNTSSITLTGTLADINSALNGLQFAPPAGENIPDQTLTVTVDDNGNVDFDQTPELGDTAKINIVVDGDNDAPVITLPAPANFSLGEDTNAVFGVSAGRVISLFDIDANGNNLTLTVSATNAKLVLVNTGGLASISNNNSGKVIATGTEAALNAALDGLVLDPVDDFVGTLTLTVHVDDNGFSGRAPSPNQSDEKSLQVSYTPVNDAPTVTPQQSPLNANEDTTITLSSGNLNGVTINDVDLGSGQPRVTLTVGKGTLTLSRTTGLTFSKGDGLNDSTMTFVGTSKTAINAALEGMTYKPNSGVNGLDTLRITVNDQGNTGAGGPQETMVDLPINIAAVNDAPTVLAPVSVQTTNEDTPKVFSTAGGNAVQVDDVDANEGAGVVRVTLTVNNGTINLGSISNINVIDGGNGTSKIGFDAALIDANIALNGLAFTPSAEFSGNSTLSVVVNDLGNTGSGGPKSATASVTINTVSQNDAPINAIPVGAVSTNEDTVLSLVGGNLISVSDVDAGTGPIQVVVSATNGTLGATATSGVSIIGGGTTSVTLSGVITAVNSALSKLTFTPSLNFAGTATISVATSDQGNSGGGGTKTDSDSFQVTVVAQNDLPIGVADSYSVIRGSSFVASDVDGTTDAISGNNGVLANDSDVDSPRAEWVAQLATPPSHNSGVFVLNPNGTFNYTHNGDTATTDSFTYRISDGTSVNPIDVTVTISINDAPVISPVSPISINENAPNNTLVADINASDANGNGISYAIIGGNTNSAFSINSVTGIITVANTSQLNFEVNPTFTLTVQATDNAATPASSTANVVVNLVDLTEAVVVGPSAWTNAGLTVKLDPSGTLLRIVTSGTDNNAVLEQHVLSKVNGLSVVGRAAADDRLVVDFSNGSPVPVGGISYDGGAAGNDSLELSNGVGFTTITHNFSSASSGSVTVATANAQSVITYSGLEPIIDNLGTANRVFNYSSSADAVTLSDGAAGDGRLGLASPGTGERVDFIQPSSSLSITLGSGDDSFTASSIDSLFAASLFVAGGDGKDSLNAAAIGYAVNFDGGANDDTLIGGSGADTLLGAAGNDRLIGNDGNDRLLGGANTAVVVGGVSVSGRDILTGGAGSDELNGQGGSSDEIQEVLAGVIVIVGSVDSSGVVRGTISANGEIDNITASELLTVTGSGSGDSIDASGWTVGDLVLDGSGGNDTITGSPMRDTILGGSGNDILSGGIGVDAILGGDGNDVILGGADNDVLDGQAGNDNVLGGAGNDSLSGGSGSDTLNGQGGSNDAIRETLADTGVVATLTPTSFVIGATTDLLVGIELAVIVGGSGADTINAAAWTGPTTLNGAGGNDKIFGGSGFDSILGGTGDDKIVGNGDVDLIFGEDGNDSIDGGDGNDGINGGNGNDKIRGGNGNDKIFGGAGADSLLGSAGDDSILGGDGGDLIIGEAGSDTIKGEGGADTLAGGGNGQPAIASDVVIKDLSDALNDALTILFETIS